MSKGEYVLLLLGMGAVTYLPRWLPLHSLSHRRLPPWLVEWLDLIPVAILSALVAPILLASPEPRLLSLGRPELWVALPTFAFAWKTRSLGGTVVLGMALHWLASSLL